MFEAWKVVPLEEYVYGAVPPVAVMVTVPFEPPLHETLVLVDVAASAAGCVIVTDTLDVHVLASVIITL